jgi:hypothetical protein
MSLGCFETFKVLERTKFSFWGIPSGSKRWADFYQKRRKIDIGTNPGLPYFGSIPS